MNKIKEDWWICNFQTSGFRKKHLGEFIRGNLIVRKKNKTFHKHGPINNIDM